MASPDQITNPLLVGIAIRSQIQSDGNIPIDVPLEKEFCEGTDYTVTDHVNKLHSETCKSSRTRQIITSVVNHLHAIVRETKPSNEEWEEAIDFITRAGKESKDKMNVVFLLGAVLGLNTLINDINHPKPLGCTSATESGPFYLQDAPEYPSGSTIIKADTKGERMFFFATVKNTKGEGILGVKADTWQADGDGVYDVQYQGGMDDRGRIVAEPNGDFCYRGVLPTAYHVPAEGPVKDLLAVLGRHPNRSTHLHFTINAPGYESLTTQIYPSHSPFLGTDAAFATKPSLVSDVVEVTDPRKWAEMGFKEGEVTNGRVWLWKYDFVLPTTAEVEALKTL